MLVNLIKKEKGKPIRLLFALTSDNAIASSRVGYFRSSILCSSFMLISKHPNVEASEELILWVTQHWKSQSERSDNVSYDEEELPFFWVSKISSHKV